jgi:hypothetical protein
VVLAHLPLGNNPSAYNIVCMLAGVLNTFIAFQPVSSNELHENTGVDQASALPHTLIFFFNSSLAMHA